ncbi:AI-2E family transporter [Oryzomonas japonica]|uniref:AI-2E family transporter n=1 Tax=Oryzomonas japonica TaxID=2603858 RepID=A0A7J4ZX23_9BACT|nr:AI-2E family transporter [Oryzomonas japonica]KAB0667645.1 AI-2E family transporter [Oryzomonas japonica]
MEHHTEHQSVRRSDYGRLIAIIMLLCLLAAAGYALQHTISCFLLSWIIAYLLDPVLVQAERRGMKRLFALGLLYVALGILIVFFFAFMLPKLTISWNGILAELPTYIQRIKLDALEWKSRLPDRYGSEEIQWILDKVSANADTAAEKAGAWVYVFGTRIFFNLFNIVLSPILVFFMLYYKQTIIDTASSWVPEQRREMFLNIGREVNTSIGGYLRGQAIVSIIVAFLSLTALFILDIPHPIISGIFAGAASVLPFIGVFIAALPALFFAWFKYQTMASLAQTAAAFGVIYFLEGYVIKPLVFRGSMNLNPLVTIIMVMALGELLGFWGILLALPIAAAIKITWGHLHNGDFRD